jgi:hypothetical protein
MQLLVHWDPVNEHAILVAVPANRRTGTIHRKRLAPCGVARRTTRGDRLQPRSSLLGED